MQLRYEEDFVEAAVFVYSSGRRNAPMRLQASAPDGLRTFVAAATKDCTGPHPLQVARFHREREQLYAILDPDERNAAFFRLQLDWFREWGIEKILTDVLGEFPLLRASLNLLAFRKAHRRNEEGAELYVPRPANGTAEPPAGNAVVALRVERFEHDDSVVPFLRHEFMHLHDMVDTAFGYVPELELAVTGMNQQRLARERYRLLWDIVIDGCLTRTNRKTVAGREQRWAEFAREFSFWPEKRRQCVFDDLWLNATPKHCELAALVADPHDLHSACEPKAGAPCPLCGFPTFDWSDTSRLSADVKAIIVAEFPHWRMDQGLCGRCHEAYQVAMKSRAETGRAGGALQTTLVRQAVLD